jgi:hypothetical protein
MSGLRVWVFALVALMPFTAGAQENDQSLAEQLANPISSLISVPFQYNYDCCYGPLDGNKSTLNIQPVIPTGVSPYWNLITRTIMPVVGFTSPAPGVDSEFGLSDTVQSFFFSPKATHNGVTWGIGPVFLWPTGTDRDLSSNKWGVGPTFVILKQQSGWTVGVLTNHIWSYADTGGGASRPEVNATFIQPFLSYTWKDSTTLTLNTESTYDWTADQWNVPINLVLSHVYNFGKQPVQLSAGGRVYADTPDGGPEWGCARRSDFSVPDRRVNASIETGSAAALRLETKLIRVWGRRGSIKTRPGRRTSSDQPVWHTPRFRLRGYRMSAIGT